MDQGPCSGVYCYRYLQYGGVIAKGVFEQKVSKAPFFCGKGGLGYNRGIETFFIKGSGCFVLIESQKSA